MDGQAKISCDALVFSAHPDDAEMAMGGTLLRLVDAGYKIVHCALTAGQMGAHGDERGRRAEFAAACRFIGCRGEILDFCDTEIENSPANQKRIADVIREHAPKIVFAPFHTNAQSERGGIAHVDHYNCGALVRDGAKIARMRGVKLKFPAHDVQRLFYFMVPINLAANVIVDVSEVIERTMDLIRCYQQQMAIKSRGSNIEDLLKIRRAALGMSNGFAFAEPFIADETLAFTPDIFFAV